MDRTYRVIAEWECSDFTIVTVKTPRGCSVMEKKEWCKLFGRLHPELWVDGKRIKRKRNTAD